MEKRSPEQIGQYYDKMAPFFETIWGDSVHFGYWPDPSDQSFTMIQAQKAFTSLTAEYMRLQPGQRGLDVGCGTGRPSIQIAETTGAYMTGITVSAEQVRLARENAQKSSCPERLTFELINAMDMPFEDNSFDAAMAIECIFHMPSRLRVFQEMARVIRPGGRIVIPDSALLRPMTDDEIDALYPTFEINEIATWQDHIIELQEAGLKIITCHDVSINTLRPSNTASLNSLQDPDVRKKLGEVYGEDQVVEFYEGWKRVKEASETLAYIIFVAEKPA